MSATPGNKWTWAIKSTARHGTDPYGQSSDGTGLDGDLAAFNANGSVTDSGISVGGILNLGGGPGSIYGQVPIGAINGSNRTFTLDLAIAGRYPLLTRNGISQNPPNDGPRSNTNPEFTFTINTNNLTLVTAPSAGDELYIWYIAGPLVPLAEIVQWELIVTTAFTNNALNTASALVSPHGTTTFAFGQIPISLGSSTYSVRTDTYDLTNGTYQGITFNATTTSDQLAAYTVTFWTSVYPDASGLETLSEQASLSIYDCYLQATRADTTTTKYSPSSQSVDDVMGLGGVGLAVCDNPLLAIDGDPATFAVLHNHAVAGLFWTLVSPNSLNISGFAS